MNDENDFAFIEGIFENLTPDDFQIDTSAIGIVDLAGHDAQFAGPEAFERFVNRQLDVVRISYATAEGEINPICVLANTETQYVFIPDEDESLEAWINRMRREAHDLNASWTFIARKCLVGQAAEGEADDAAIGDEDVFDRAAARGRMKVGILFYAQRRENELVEHRQGYMHEDDGILGDVNVGRTTQQVPIFNLLD